MKTIKRLYLSEAQRKGVFQDVSVITFQNYSPQLIYQLIKQLCYVVMLLTISYKMAATGANIQNKIV